jgi:hypothetical protein
LAWFKVDDGFYSCAKVMSIPRTQRLSAVGLWTMCGNWSARQLSDGVVPAYVLAELGATPKLRQALVTARLWLDQGSVNGRSSLDQIEFHDWAKYQPTRAQVEEAREKERIRKDKYRLSHRDTEGTPPSVPWVSQGVSQGVSGHPDPTRPDPTPITSNEVIKERPAKRGSRLSTEWLPSSASIAKAREDAPAVDHQAEHATFVDYWIAQPGQRGVKTDWDATWRNWMRRKQGDVKTRPSKQTPEERLMATLALAADIDMKGIES